ncbi:MAG: DUF2314 domain-containing protein [Pseudomonadota bacterium]
MLRLLIIAGISLASVVPYLAIFNRWLDIGNDLAGYVSLPLAWIVTPYVLLKVWPGKPDPNVIPVDPDDPIMSAAVARARSQIERFQNGLQAGRKEAFIKFPYQFGDHTEHVWGSAHSLDGDFVIASLESMPVGELPEAVFERLRIPLDDVEDWMLVDAKGTTEGGYSTIAHAKVYERDYGPLPKHYRKQLETFVDHSDSVSL